MPTEARRPRWESILLILAAWTIAGLFFGSQLYALWPAASGRRISWGHALAVNLPFYYLWALLTPLLVSLARRYRPQRGAVVRVLLAHVLASLAVTAGQLALANVILFPDDLFRGDRSVLAALLLGDFFRLNFHINFLTYWGVVALVWAYDDRRRAHQRELQASALKTRLVEAELAALQRQLHPHFVFNTLNAISALIPRDAAAAERMLVDLSTFLRLTLQSSGRDRVTLREELDFLERYLRIEQTRLSDRLRVDFDIDSESLGAEVPSLILQPLVENAIRHGIAPRPGPGRVEVRAHRDADELILTVLDDGRGLGGGAAGSSAGAASSAGTGIGLSNTRERLRHLYGDAGSLTLSPALGRGVRVTVTMPYREADPPSKPEITRRAAAGSLIGGGLRGLVPALRGARERSPGALRGNPGRAIPYGKNA